MENVALAILLVLAFVLGFMTGSLPMDDYHEGRCKERWKYQNTYQDTLATLRTGCELPPTAIRN